MTQEFAEALERAKKLEIDGIEFYTQAAQKCGSEAGKHMFRSFAGDERRHLRVIKDLVNGLGVDLKGFPTPRAEIQTIFSEARGGLDDLAGATAAEKDAVEFAMGMETESFNLYDGAAKLATDDLARQLFERLASEENQHYEMLENTLQYLNDNEKWFLWSEWALITGDQSSLGMQ